MTLQNANGTEFEWRGLAAWPNAAYAAVVWRTHSDAANAKHARGVRLRAMTGGFLVTAHSAQMGATSLPLMRWPPGVRIRPPS